MISSANTVGRTTAAVAPADALVRSAARRRRGCVLREPARGWLSMITTAAVDDDAEVDRAHREQVGRHAAQLQVDERASAARAG